MYISRVTKIDDHLAKAIKDLFPQLTTSRKPPEKEDLKEIIATDSTILLILAKDKAGLEIIGTLSIAFYKTPSGHHAWVEDVIVDKQFRGKGLGKALMNKALDLARERKAYSVNLTSMPERLAANKLYQKMGFKKNKTNLYKYTL